MPSGIESQIKERIAEFVNELDLLVRKSTLEALHGILAKGDAPTARRGRPAGKRRGPGRPRGRGRSSAGLDEATAKVAAHVKANDGQSISEIAGATGLALPLAKRAAAALLADGTLKKSGQKRGTKYHAGSGRAPARGKAKKARGRGRKAKAA